MSGKGGRRALAFVGVAAAAAWLAYGLSALAGVFGRSVASVENTSWLSFGSGKLSFASGAGRWDASSGAREFSFIEDSGIVTAEFKGGGRRFFVREGERELIAGDGREVWYLYETSEPAVG